MNLETFLNALPYLLNARVHEICVLRNVTSDFECGLRRDRSGLVRCLFTCQSEWIDLGLYNNRHKRRKTVGTNSFRTRDIM